MRCRLPQRSLLLLAETTPILAVSDRKRLGGVLYVTSIPNEAAENDLMIEGAESHNLIFASREAELASAQSARTTFPLRNCVSTGYSIC